MSGARRIRGWLAIVAIVAPVALFARWSWYQDGQGPAYLPSPDALEYAAAAQSIATDGTFLIQVAQHRVRPRYSPGWPLVQAVALGAGVDGAALWRLTALLGAALACAIAGVTKTALEITFSSTTAGGASSEEPARRTALVAGIAAGLAWALSPLAATSGGTAMSDEPTALACFVALAALGLALTRRDPGIGAARAATALALGGGLAAGFALTMRAVEGLLLAPPLAGLALHAARRRGVRHVARVVALAALGALPPVLATMAVLARSGVSPWRWSAYEHWAPERFGDLSVTFSWTYAWVANPHIPAYVGVSPVGQLRAYALTFLGLAGPHNWMRFGTAWPLLGWAALGVLAVPPLARRVLGRAGSADPAGIDETGDRASRRGAGGADAPLASLGVGAIAVALWCVTHWLVFGAYFYPDPRFVLGALAWCPVALAVGLGRLAIGGAHPRARSGAVLAASLVLALLLGDAWAHHPKRRVYEPRNDETRAELHRFLAWDDATRARERVPFDTVLAQALGWFPASRAALVSSWGPPPAIKQANLLIRSGYLRADGTRNAAGASLGPERPVLSTREDR